MDANWRPTQGTESTMDASDWRTQLQPDSRQRIVNKIMDTLKRHLSVSGQDGLHELRQIAVRFEEKFYAAATSQSDYLRKISLKMLTMENKTQNTMVNPMQSNAGGPSNKPIDSGIPVLSQVHNPGQSHAIPVPYHNQQANDVQLSMQPMLQQHSQSVVRQQQQQHTSINNQQQISTSQQQILASQQQQLLALQSNVTSMQHPQLVGQQNNVSDRQQHLRLLVGEQNDLSNLQQHQQQLINMQNHLANWHQQQLVSNVPGLQQQQMLVTQSGNSSKETNQHSLNMLQQSKVPVQQQSQQNVTNLLQSQPAQLQQQLGLLQPPNPLQRDMQQRLHASSSLLQQQNVLDQQKHLYQSQRALQNSSSTSLDSRPQTGKSGGDDWQEEVYQKIKSMKELYFPELTEMLQKIAAKLRQHESLPHQPRSEQAAKLQMFKSMLERLLAFLQISKGNIIPSFKEKITSYEKQIINFINTNRPKKAMSSMQLGQLPPPHMHPASQPQSQLTQLQSHENQMSSQVQSTNFLSSVTTMPRDHMASLHHNSIPSISGMSTVQQNMANSIQPDANLNSSSVNSLQQVGASSLQQNSLNAPQQENADQQQQSCQSQRTLPGLSSTSLASTALTGKSGGDDWQDVCQKEKRVRKSPEPTKEPVFSCPICMDPLVEEMSTRCGHIFCKGCIKAAINAQGKCPTCRKRANVKELIRIFLPSTT